MQLNRQQLGSKNWGSSVNANWGKIEQETNRLQGEINKIINQIETEYGVMFGGFIRFDSADIAQADEAPNYLYITPSADTAIDKESHTFFLEDSNQKSTVPINRIYRIVGNWSAGSGATQNDQNIYSVNWTEGNMCVYTGAGYRQVFWNDWFYQPVGTNSTGEIVWRYTSSSAKNEVSTSFLGNLAEAEHYIYYTKDFKVIDGTPTKLRCKVPYKVPSTIESSAEPVEGEESATVSDGVKQKYPAVVQFYDKDQVPFYASWELTTGGTNDTYLTIDSGVMVDGDFVVLTYYNVNDTEMPVIRMGPHTITKPGECLGIDNSITFRIEVLSGQINAGDHIQLCRRTKYKGSYKLKSFLSHEITSEELEEYKECRYFEITVTGGKALKNLLSTGTRATVEVVEGEEVVKHQFSNYHPKYIRVRRPINRVGNNDAGAYFSNEIAFYVFGRFDTKTYSDSNKTVYQSHGRVTIQ